MFSKGQHLKAVRTLGMAAVVAMGLASCATYDDEFANINSRLDQLDTRVQGAAQSAQEANQRLDRLENRVQQLETAPPRVPRG
jgi:murein lipoprotein